LAPEPIVTVIVDPENKGELIFFFGAKDGEFDFEWKLITANEN